MCFCDALVKRLHFESSVFAEVRRSSCLKQYQSALDGSAPVLIHPYPF
jgi:hypothetical protein